MLYTIYLCMRHIRFLCAVFCADKWQQLSQMPFDKQSKSYKPFSQGTCGPPSLP